jgi:DNA mismatch endonuclease, patch repair protein
MPFLRCWREQFATKSRGICSPYRRHHSRDRKALPLASSKKTPPCDRESCGPFLLKDKSAELALLQALHAESIRGYRLHDVTVPGTPDLVFRRLKIAVFVAGCFWHGCKKCYRAPKTNSGYWSMKVKRNTDRGAMVNAQCRENGWKVVRIWEHEAIYTPRRATWKIKVALQQQIECPPCGLMDAAPVASPLWQGVRGHFCRSSRIADGSRRRLGQLPNSWE